MLKCASPSETVASTAGSSALLKSVSQTSAKGRDTLIEQLEEQVKVCVRDAADARTPRWLTAAVLGGQPAHQRLMYVSAAQRNAASCRNQL